MRIAIAQVRSWVGDIPRNFETLSRLYEVAGQHGATLLVTSELFLEGYPLYDWIYRPEILLQSQVYFARLVALTQNRPVLLAVGHLIPNPDPRGKPFQNCVSLLGGGVVLFCQAKTLLPTYDVFDEARYFAPATHHQAYYGPSAAMGFGICEDFWGTASSFPSPMEALWALHQKRPLDCLFSLSASPYTQTKAHSRMAIHQPIARRFRCPLVWVNQVGAVDEVLFDGSSFLLDANGAVAGRLPAFQEQLSLFEYGTRATASTPSWHEVHTHINKKAVFFPLFPATSFYPSSPATEGCVGDPTRLREMPIRPLRTGHDGKDPMTLLEALVCGVREYVLRTKSQKLLIGLSGGIDSAVVACIARLAVGADSVYGVAMPSRYSSEHSVADAVALAQNLGFYTEAQFQIRSIDGVFSQYESTLSDVLPGGNPLSDLSKENLQSRIRGAMLMAISGSTQGMLVLATGNKSELSVGYCTLYGDTVGALSPIGDLYKTEVYALAAHINAYYEAWIPSSTMEKPPSAELAFDQLDSDALPPYPVLDALIADFLQNQLTMAELETRYANEWPPRPSTWVQDILRLHQRMEFKRKQAPPILRVHDTAYGLGRRVPLAKSDLSLSSVSSTPGV